MGSSRCDPAELVRDGRMVTMLHLIRPPPREEEAMAEQAMNRFCWNELATPDTAGCTRFYSEVFGWTPRTMEFGPHTYTLFQAGKENDGQDVCGMLQMTAEWGNVPAHWMAYIAVADVDACAK